MKKRFRKIETDVLTIGTGAAGCAAAIAAAEMTAKVVLTSKGIFGRSGTTCLGGAAYAAALGHGDEKDSPEYHFLDTVTEGRYIGNQELVRILAEEAPRTVYDLERYGVPWYKNGETRTDPPAYDYNQVPTPGHRYPRGIHHNETTGQAIQKALCKEVRKHSHNIRVVDDLYIWSLIVHDRRVRGALGLDLRTGDVVAISSKSLVLATGGAGSSYKVTDMDTGATGDGYAMALQAGVELIDMEFTQFYPTAFVFPESIHGMLVITSPLWTKGLKLFNREGERFMARQYPRWGENLPRDILSRAIFLEIAEGRGTAHGGVWLDASDIQDWESFQKEHPRTFMWPERFGVNSRRFEVAPTYHFTMGGIRINEKCETNLIGLFAAGEIAGGVHGANRLAGNALSECVVFGQIAGKEAALFRKEPPLDLKDSVILDEIAHRTSVLRPESPRGKTHSSPLIRKLREIMYRYVGVVRNRESLKKAQQELAQLREEVSHHLTIHPGLVFNYDQIHALELRNMIELGEVITGTALRREESRGAHYRSDYPNPDDSRWFRNILCRKGEDQFKYRTVSIKTPYVKLPSSENHEKRRRQNQH